MRGLVPAALAAALALGGAGPAGASDGVSVVGWQTGAHDLHAAPDRVGLVRSGRLSLALRGAARERAGGRVLMTRRVSYGRRARVLGGLTAADGRAIAGAEVEVRGHLGLVLARTRTDAGGRFGVDVRPDASGPLRVGVRVSGRLVRPRSTRALRVLVRPRARLRASTTAPRAGARVVFTGSIRPAPWSVRGPATKAIVLEWRDPLRGSWRPVVNARARPDGSFAVPWRFTLKGLTIPVRVRVPTEGAWPLLPALSREVALTVR